MSTSESAALRQAHEQIAVLQQELTRLRTASGADGSAAGGHASAPMTPTTSTQPGSMFQDYALGLGLGRQQTPVNVCIPMSGLREGPFADAGYRFPKPLINVVGRPVLHWVIEALVLTPTDNVFLAISDRLEAVHGVHRHVQRAFPRLKVHLITLTAETVGWVETMAAMTRSMPLEIRQRRTLCVDCHTITHGFDIVGAFRTLPEDMGVSFFCNFGGDQAGHKAAAPASERPLDLQSEDSTIPFGNQLPLGHGRFSYVQIADGGIITDIREKVAISGNVNIGAYGFPSAALLLTATETYIDRMLAASNGPTSPSLNYHASALINWLMSQKTTFRAVAVERSEFATVGTPDELTEFIGHVSSLPLSEGWTQQQFAERTGANPHSLNTLMTTRQLRFCFDLESTLLCPDTHTGELQPQEDNVDLVRALKDAGHVVIIQSSASMETSLGNVGRALANSGLRVLEALKQHAIPYDEVHFGKPSADFYIDSVTLNAGAGTLAKDIGWRKVQDMRTIEGGIRARSFNQIALVDDRSIIKSSSRKVLAGEAYWYANIPKALANLFPRLIEIVDRAESDTMSIMQERVVGVTLSHMLVNLTLTAGRLQLLLDALLTLHTYKPIPEDVPAGSDEGERNVADMCSNYTRKVGSRYRKHRGLYETFAAGGMRPDTASTKILDFLKGYEAAGRCQHAWYIHGVHIHLARVVRAFLPSECASCLHVSWPTAFLRTGDPVFSNAILSRDGGVKLIDMRGALGEQLTTQGDMHYDLSKVYQSLCGYDFMLLDKRITEGTAHYLAGLRECFWSHVRCVLLRPAAISGSPYPHHLRSLLQLLPVPGVGDLRRAKYPRTAERDIRLLTATHFFSIVPLHEERDHQERYLRASESMLVVEGLM